MKKRHLLFIPILALWAACEDVVEIQTPSEPPRLVVEGVIRVDTTQEFLPVAIRLSETSSFFEEIRRVNDAEEMVIIMQAYEDGIIVATGSSEMELSESGEGVYIPVVVPGDVDERIPTSIITQDVLYTLVITRNGRRYAAQTKYVPAVPIESLAQGSAILFEEDETEVIVTFTDAPGADNFYILDFGFGNFLPTEDTFYKGQRFQFSYFYDQTFSNGTELGIGLLGADQNFYNYMNLLVQQTDGQQGPFQPPIATVRGNVFDVTGLDNLDQFDNTGQPGVFPLGYFAVVQEFRDTLTVQNPD